MLTSNADNDNNDPANKKATGAEANYDKAQGAEAVYPEGDHVTADTDEDNNNVDVGIPNGNVLTEHIDNDYASKQGSFQEGEDLEFGNNNNVEFYKADVDSEPDEENGANQTETTGAGYDNAEDNISVHNEVSEAPRYNL